MTLDDLSEINDITKIKNFIKRFILEDEVLYRLIYFNCNNPLDETTYFYPENPYIIFEESNDTNNIHGIVLFDRKNDSILNYETINVLVDFESIIKANSKELNKIMIIFRIIAKGVDIRFLENGTNRIFAIEKLIDDNFNKANINNLGEVKQQSISDLNLNEENLGQVVIYRSFGFNSNISSNKNFKKRIFGIE
jgi:hypothetical protein